MYADFPEERTEPVHAWRDFKKFKRIDGFLPSEGEGDTRATQAATAIAKLVYRWFNDGDVYYGTGEESEFASFANWLWKWVPETQHTLEEVRGIFTEDDYTEILWDVATIVESRLSALSDKKKIGSVYNEPGPFDDPLW